MTLIIETIHDLQRILDSRPDWRWQIRQSLYPSIDVPKAFQELAEAQRRSDEKFKELAEAQRETERLLQQLTNRVDKLVEAQRHTEVLLQQLTNRMDLLAETQRRTEVLLQQLTTRVDGLETRVERVETKVDRLETKVDRLETKVDGLETRVDRIEVQLVEAAQERKAIREEAAQERQAIRDDLVVIKRNQDQLRGSSYEGQFRSHAPAIFGYFLRRGKAVRSQIGDLLEDAEDNGQISEQEHEHVLASDLLWRGKLKSTKEEAVLVVEVSWLAEKRDLERAVARATVLRRIGIKALPVVAGVNWVDGLAKEALSQGAVIVTNTRLDKTSWQAAVAAIS